MDGEITILREGAPPCTQCFYSLKTDFENYHNCQTSHTCLVCNYVWLSASFVPLTGHVQRCAGLGGMTETVCCVSSSTTQNYFGRRWRLSACQWSRTEDNNIYIYRDDIINNQTITKELSMWLYIIIEILVLSHI